MHAGIRVGIDTGGTFTDVVAIDARSGRVATTKTPSTPHDPAVGFMAGLRKALALLDQPGARPEAVCHGTTVATNALLQDDFSGLGFVTTEGFRHVLEIARQSVPDSYGNSYFWIKPDRIVPLHLVAEVPERLDHTGDVVRPFDEAAAAEVARWCRARGFDAVGVSFLHSYANPEHERRMRAVFEREFPECAVSISSDVLREYREYERAVTTLVDAFVKPRTSSYVARIEGELAAFANGAGPPPFYVMKSNGGVISAPEVARAPITTILSGPAAGALGAAFVARAAGFERVLTLDGGGTSTDVSVVAGGEARLTTEGAVGRFPVKVPMVDVVTVGTGGGSIARRSPEGNLKVGPRSAGADPGPMCYARGGDEPTLTDANVVLGRIPPHLLGGEIPLDVDAARTGIERLASELAMDADACAAGVLEVAAWNQANAIRQLTVRRGLDVRDFAMIAFGGSGPLLACTLADVLGLPAVVVPPDPGNLSALGLLTVDVRNDFVRTFVRRHADASLDEIGAVYDDLERQATGALAREGFEGDECVLARAADLRYFGQAFEVRVPVPRRPADAALASATLAAFHDEHERRYGYCYRDDPAQVVEWVNLRVTGIGPIERPPARRAPERAPDKRLEPAGERRAYFDDSWRDTLVYDRASLRAHDVVAGPAIVEEFGSTTPVAPGFAARVDAGGNLVVTRGGAT